MPTTWTDALLDELSRQGDPAVDEVIQQHAALAETGTDPRALLRSVVQHLVLPSEQQSPPIAAYLADQPPLPPWADAALLERAATFFADQALMIGSGLFCASLPEAYASARGSRVLVLTARLVTDPVRRVYETAEMILHAMARRGLQPAAVATTIDLHHAPGRGYADIRRVRLMHATVRYLIANDPDVAKVAAPPVPDRAWLETWGVPINQEDLLGTLMTFTVAIFEVLTKLGTPPSDADQTAYLHRWSVIAHFLGIRPDLLHIDPASAVELTAAIRRRQTDPSADSHLLTSSLVDALQPALWRPFRGIVPATVRWYVGDPLADGLGIRRSAWRFVLEGPLHDLARRAGLDTARHHFLRRVMRRWNKRVMRSFLRANRDGDRPDFDIPDELAACLGAPERLTVGERFHLLLRRGSHRKTKPG